MPQLSTPTAASILSMENGEKEELAKIRFASSRLVNENASSFIAKATLVTNLNDVRKAYKALLLDPNNAQATHNIAAYILPSGAAGYSDDRDYGMGRRMLQAIEADSKIISGLLCL